jgi:hypothetical protein
MLYSGSLGLRNLEPHDEELLASIGVTSKAQFDRLGAEKTYALILEAGHDADETLLHRLRGAEHDIDWQIVAEREKRNAKSRFIDVDEP